VIIYSSAVPIFLILSSLTGNISLLLCLVKSSGILNDTTALRDTESWTNFGKLPPLQQQNLLSSQLTSYLLCSSLCTVAVLCACNRWTRVSYGIRSTICSIEDENCNVKTTPFVSTCTNRNDSLFTWSSRHAEQMSQLCKFHGLFYACCEGHVGFSISNKHSFNH
jgi:hypothetical protein